MSCTRRRPPGRQRTSPAPGRRPSGLLVTFGVLLAEAVATGTTWAQSDGELNVLYERVIELYNAGKYGEAIPLAVRYAEAIEARHGAVQPEYATALNNLAQLLQA